VHAHAWVVVILGRILDIPFELEEQPAAALWTGAKSPHRPL
jgi:hypothetical protein